MRRNRFAKFIERARRMVVLAEDEARSFNHNYIGTEHLLLGLLRDEKSVAAMVLVNLGVELEQVRSATEEVTSRGVEPVKGEINLSPLGKKCMELAVTEARRMSHHYIGTEHLLLGLLGVEDGLAAKVLDMLGVTQVRARAEILRILAQPAPKLGEAPAEELPGREQGVKRYNLVLPEDLFREVQEVADRQGTTVVVVIRRFLKLGLLATRAQDAPDSALILREGGREREILLL